MISLHNRRRRRALTFAQRHFPIVGITHPAGVFVLPSDDSTVLRKLFVGGSRSDLVVLERVVSMLAPTWRASRQVLVDVGANLGTTTMAALTMHGFERVVAIEPDAVNARCLRATVAVNGLDGRVTVVEAAVTDAVGRAPFAARLSEGREWKSGAGGIERGMSTTVCTTTLDALAADGCFDPGLVGLLWMDAQGAEGLALKGASCLLDARVPVVTAVRQKRLTKVGGLDDFTRIVRERFATFVDLRAPNLRPGWQPQQRPIEEFGDLLSPTKSSDALLLP